MKCRLSTTYWPFAKFLWNGVQGTTLSLSTKFSRVDDGIWMDIIYCNNTQDRNFEVWLSIRNCIDTKWWRHQMETFPCYWPFVRGIHRWPVDSSHKGPWRRALMFSFICAWMNGWVNNREGGDLRRHSTHYDVIVMICFLHDGLHMTLIAAWRYRCEQPGVTEQPQHISTNKFQLNMCLVLVLTARNVNDLH